MTIGYRELFGQESTWSELERDLRHYSLADVLDVVGRLSSQLDSADPDDSQVQPRLAYGLMHDRATEFLQRLALVPDNGNRRRVLFEPLQVASLAKAALLLLPPEGRLGSATSYVPLTNALLRMTDLLGPQRLPTFATEVERGEWMRFLFAMGIFYRGGYQMHDLARFELLCLRSHENLSRSAQYLDFAKLIREATGLPTHLVWLALIALSSQWQTLDAQKAAAGAMFVSDDFFDREFQFSDDERDRMFALAIRDVAETQTLVRGSFSVENFRAFDFLPLADKPLIRLDGRTFCFSVPLLRTKLAYGLYYALANSLQGAERDKFTVFLGEVFEQYLVQMLTRMFAPVGARVIKGSALATAASSAGKRRSMKTADAVVLRNGFALVVESKARFFAHAARTGADWAAIASRLEDVYSRGSRQIASTIELIEAGAVPGLSPSEIKRYMPIIVTLDETPLLPPLYDLIAPADPKVGGDKTLPLQIVGVSELEPLEAAVAAGQLDLHALLGWKGTEGRQADSLRNAVFHQPQLRPLSRANPFLAQTFNESMAGSLRILQLRKR